MYVCDAWFVIETGLSAYATARAYTCNATSHCTCLHHLLTCVWSVTIRPSGFTWPRLPHWKALDEEDLPHSAPKAPGNRVCCAVYTLRGISLLCISPICKLASSFQQDVTCQTHHVNTSMPCTAFCIMFAIIPGHSWLCSFVLCYRGSHCQGTPVSHSMQCLGSADNLNT